MSELIIQCWSTFCETEKWKFHGWYPLPYGCMDDTVPVDTYVIECWGIYKLETKGGSDIVPVEVDCPLSFSQALNICQEKNNFKMKFDWINKGDVEK